MESIIEISVPAFSTAHAAGMCEQSVRHRNRICREVKEFDHSILRGNPSGDGYLVRDSPEKVFEPRLTHLG